jgi:uncharacterized membrane protein YGL010W
MTRNSKLLEMLTGYAAAHRHPLNIGIHLVCIPAIMLGALIALSWVSLEIRSVTLNLAWLLVGAFFLFYLTLDLLFASVFLVAAAVLTVVAMRLGELEFATSATIAAALFVGGYIAQFIGHAIERSPPVLLKHPIQAQLAAPFFTIVELFQLLGLRNELFSEVERRLAAKAAEQSSTTPT